MRAAVHPRVHFRPCRAGQGHGDVGVVAELGLVVEVQASARAGSGCQARHSRLRVDGNAVVQHTPPALHEEPRSRLAHARVVVVLGRQVLLAARNPVVAHKREAGGLEQGHNARRGAGHGEEALREHSHRRVRRSLKAPALAVVVGSIRGLVQAPVVAHAVGGVRLAPFRAAQGLVGVLDGSVNLLPSQLVVNALTLGPLQVELAIVLAPGGEVWVSNAVSAGRRRNVRPGRAGEHKSVVRVPVRMGKLRGGTGNPTAHTPVRVSSNLSKGVDGDTVLVLQDDSLSAAEHNDGDGRRHGELVVRGKVITVPGLVAEHRPNFARGNAPKSSQLKGTAGGVQRVDVELEVVVVPIDCGRARVGNRNAVVSIRAVDEVSDHEVALVRMRHRRPKRQQQGRAARAHCVVSDKRQGFNEVQIL
eukprot:Rhum_TRINITY_DN22821_c0_g1::Rhum_TRINITY_DN22821_c0_g1_i1::g.176230::m.176230